MSDSINIDILNKNNTERVKTVAAVLVNPETGKPYIASGGGSTGGGGDASSSNQQATITLLDKLNTKFGEEADAVAASPVNTATFMSLFKSVGSILYNMRDRLPPTLGPKITTQSLSVVPASDGTLVPGLLQTDAAGVVASGAKMISIKNIGTTAVTLAGGSLPVGETISFNTTFGVLDSITYGDGKLLITTLR